MDSPLCPLEAYDAATLMQDLIARKPIRISVPESLTGFLRVANVDWSREVEIPLRGVLAGGASDFDQLAQAMADLKGRFLGLQTFVYLRHGRIFYTMLGGTRYAARVDWSLAMEPESPAFSSKGMTLVVPRASRIRLLSHVIDPEDAVQSRSRKDNL